MQASKVNIDSRPVPTNSKNSQRKYVSRMELSSRGSSYLMLREAITRSSRWTIVFHVGKYIYILSRPQLRLFYFINNTSLIENVKQFIHN
jgi:hypothetical protein